MRTNEQINAAPYYRRPRSPCLLLSPAAAFGPIILRHYEYEMLEQKGGVTNLRKSIELGRESRFYDRSKER